MQAASGTFESRVSGCLQGQPSPLPPLPFACFTACSALKEAMANLAQVPPAACRVSLVL